MAFCKFCGRELQEGEVCNCQAGNTQDAGTAQGTNAVQDTGAAQTADAVNTTPAQPQPTPVQPAAPEQPNTAQSTGSTPPQPSVTITLPNKDALSGVGKKIISTITGVLKHPSTEGRAFVAHADRNASLGIIVIQAILSSIFSMIIIGKINSLLGFDSPYAEAYKFSGIKAFFVTLLFSLIFSVILAALFYLAAIILKLGTNLNQILSVVAVRSIALMPVIVLACIVFLINMGVGLTLFYGSILLAMLFLMEAVRGIPNMQDNKVAYTVLVITIVFIVLFVMLGTKLALNMYLSKALRELLSGNSIIEALLEEML